MTRVNAGLKKGFSDELLLNALGEEPRILREVIKRIGKGHNFDDIPQEFTLNKGHMKFFYNKCGFIYGRYQDLRHEYRLRHGKQYSIKHLKRITARFKYILKVRPDLCQDWTPTPAANDLVRERILSRSQNYVKSHNYFNQPITNFKKLLYENT